LPGLSNAGLSAALRQIAARTSRLAISLRLARRLRNPLAARAIGIATILFRPYFLWA
jgi:hypothetical protein